MYVCLSAQESLEAYPPGTMDDVDEFDLKLLGTTEDGAPDIRLLKKLVAQITDGVLSPRVKLGLLRSFTAFIDRHKCVQPVRLCLVGGGVQGGFFVRSLVDGAGSYSVAHRAGLLPTELTGMWGWILLRYPHQGRGGSPPAPAPTKQRPAVPPPPLHPVPVCHCLPCTLHLDCLSPREAVCREGGGGRGVGRAEVRGVGVQWWCACLKGVGGAGAPVVSVRR